ncbi:MAG: hypothetical protein M3N29_06075 [Chloroflexota bacterium]|nr:hypothetical protein [Chloroflexota bacterium]
MLGVIGGLLAIYLVVIGVVERFEPRPFITGVSGLGLLAPLLGILLVSYQSGRTPRSWHDPAAGRARVVIPPIVTGAIAGLVIAALVLLEESLNVRFVFPNLTPRSVDIITLRSEFPLAIAVAIVLGTAVGALAAVLHVIPNGVRRALLIAAGVVVLLSLVEPLLRVVLLQLGQPAIAGFFYRGGGLTQAAAVSAFVVSGALALAMEYRGDQAQRVVQRMPANQRLGARALLIAVAGAVLLFLPAIVGPFLSEVVVIVGLYLLMGLGLNIVVGYAGLLDLGYVAFFAVGAYAAAILTSPVSALGWEMSLWLALPLVMLVAAITGIAIGAPVLRLRGDYLAIVTLGFGEIVRFLLLSDWLRPFFGGAQGILQVPAPDLFGIRFFGPQQLYYPVLLSVIIGGVVAWSLANSRVGRAWNAMREDEDVAEATGINTTRYKLLAFAIGAVYGCLAGAFLAVRLGSVFPHQLDILVSITVLALIILGGMGSIRGVIVGALVLVGLPELLREFGEYRLLIYGAVLVAMMLLRPEGLLPSATRRRELHEEEPEELQYLREAGGETGGPGITGASA